MKNPGGFTDLLLNKYIALIAFALVTAWCLDAHAVDPIEVRLQAKRILDDPSFQKKLLNNPTPQPDTHACGGKKLVIGKKSSTSAKISFFELLAWLWVGLALVLVAIWIVAFIRRKKLHDTPGVEPEEGQGDEKPLELSQAQYLASLERFVEAIHQIFLLTVSGLAEKKGRTVSSWMTSRELSLLLPSGKQEREVFHRLVRTVETGLFAGKPLGRSDYERCLDDYMQLLGDS